MSRVRTTLFLLVVGRDFFQSSLGANDCAPMAHTDPGRGDRVWQQREAELEAEEREKKRQKQDSTLEHSLFAAFNAE